MHRKGRKQNDAKHLMRQMPQFRQWNSPIKRQTDKRIVCYILYTNGEQYAQKMKEAFIC